MINQSRFIAINISITKMLIKFLKYSFSLLIEGDIFFFSSFWQEKLRRRVRDLLQRGRMVAFVLLDNPEESIMDIPVWFCKIFHIFYNPHQCPPYSSSPSSFDYDEVAKFVLLISVSVLKDKQGHLLYHHHQPIMKDLTKSLSLSVNVLNNKQHCLHFIVIMVIITIK